MFGAQERELQDLEFVKAPGIFTLHIRFCTMDIGHEHYPYAPQESTAVDRNGGPSVDARAAVTGAKRP